MKLEAIVLSTLLAVTLTASYVNVNESKKAAPAQTISRVFGLLKFLLIKGIFI